MADSKWMIVIGISSNELVLSNLEIFRLILEPKYDDDNPYGNWNQCPIFKHSYEEQH